MRDELYTNLGFYSSAFLKMNVDTGEDLTKFQDVVPQTEATYFHEYIHYLQDIFTTYGLMNICAVVDFIKLGNNEILTKDEKEFEVPIVPQASLENDVKSNWDLKVLYAGSGQSAVRISKINSICKCVTPITTRGGVIRPEKLIIDFNDTNGKNQKYEVGAYSITESMAYTMEKALYSEFISDAPQLPYEVVKVVCDYLLPGLSENPLNIVALCDVSLMLFSPGQFLYDIVMGIANTGKLPDTPEDIYRHAYKNIVFNYNGHTTIQQLFISQSSLASQQLSDYFTTPNFMDNKTWINYIFSSGVDFRIRNPFFMLDIVRNGTILLDKKINNTLFNHLWNKLGSPITVNNDNDMTFIQPTNTSFQLLPEYLWVIRQIYDIYIGKVTNGTYRCQMIDWCDKTAKENTIGTFTDHRCREAPWERSIDPDPNFCTFGRLWKTWGLAGKNPKEKEASK